MAGNLSSNQGVPQHFAPCSLWPKAWRFSVVFRVGKLEFFQSLWKSRFSIGNTSSNGGFLSSLMLVFGGVPSLKLAAFALKMDGWNTFLFPFGEKGLFSGANC